MNQDRIPDMALNLAGYVRNQRKKLKRGQETYTWEEVDRMWSTLEQIAEGILQAADRIERQKKLEKAEEERKRREEIEAKERERAKREEEATSMNLRCRYHVQTVSGDRIEHSCDIDYPIDHCSLNCPYATNVRAGRAKVYEVRIGRRRE